MTSQRPMRQVLDRLPHRMSPEDFPWYINSLADLGEFKGQRMVWISDWTIWSPVDDGLRHLSMLTGRPFKGKDERDFHCYLFEESNWESVKPILCVPILYGWDAYLLTEGGNSLAEISHDEYVSFAAVEGSTIGDEWLNSIAKWHDTSP